MSTINKFRATLVLSPLILAGCVTAPGSEEYSGLTSGFSTVSATTTQAIGKKTVWVQSSEEARHYLAKFML